VLENTSTPLLMIFIEIFISAFDTILRMNESLDDDQTMIAPEKMGEMLLAWTDPQWGLE
jgi:condensin complex subunit 3